MYKNCKQTALRIIFELNIDGVGAWKKIHLFAECMFA